MKSKGESLHTCELCERTGVAVTVHHLVPREEGGKLMPTALLCTPCHKQIHAIYTNRDLVVLQLTTIEALRQDDQIRSYLAWIRKQPASALPRVRKSERVRNQ